MPKDLINPTLDDIKAWHNEHGITDRACLEWLNLNYGKEKPFWYGRRTLRHAIVVAMMNKIGEEA